MMEASASVPRSLSRKEQRIVNARFFNCVEDGVFKKIERCLNEGANINARDDEGFTALHIAVTNKNLKVVKILLERGATIDIKNDDNETPLNIAERLNETSIIQLLNPQLPIPKPSQQKFGRVVEEDQQKKKSGSAVHGHIYQLKLLMLFLHRGVSNRYSFRLGTEIEEAQKFDDLVFEYTESGEKIYRLLQAKHRLYNTKKITAADLLTINNDDFSLVKYFFSYMQVKKNNFFRDGTIKDVIISTNIGFDLNNLEQNGIGVEEITSLDTILDFRGSSKRYKFSRTLVTKLKQRIIQKTEVTAEPTQTGVDLSWRFCVEASPDWSNIAITDEEISDFLDHLVFAVNQPNEEELGEIIKDEIGQKLDLDSITTENTYNKLFVKMLNWFQGKESGRFLSCEEGEDFFKQAKIGMPILFNIKDPVSSFTGRVEQLNALHEALMKDDNAVVISGLGGVGKSELARKYISLHSQNYDDKVLWMNAENYSSLSESFHRLALDKLGINTKNVDGKEKDIQSVVEDVFRFFSKGNSLFIFDNAESYKDGIKEFLPSLPGNMNKPHILITSRNQKWPNNMEVLPLNVFSETEALEVIKISLDVESGAQINDIKELVNELQFFPLALQQAVAYIRSANSEEAYVGSEFKVKDYLIKYREKSRELLDFSFLEESDDNYTKTTLTTWEVTLDHIKSRENGDLALEVMNLIAFFAPDNIRTELFLSLVDNKESLGAAIELLRQYSMINFDQTTINVHRLVQQVSRMKLREQSRGIFSFFRRALKLKQNKEEEVLRKALKLFEKDHVSSKDLDHAISVWNYSSKYIQLIKEFNWVSSRICLELHNKARFEEAFLFGRKVLELYSSLSSNDPTNSDVILATKNNMAMSVSSQGNYDTALKTFQEVYEELATINGPNHQHTLIAKSNIAQTLSKLGKDGEALKLCEEVLEACKVELGNFHPDTLTSKHNLAGILSSQGRQDEALKIWEPVSLNYHLFLGPNHPKTIDTDICIANALLEKGKYDDASRIFESVSDIQESNLGKNHPQVLLRKTNVGGLLRSQGKYSEALQMNQDVVNAEKEVLGDSHPNVLSTQDNTVRVLRDQGKYDEALKLCQEVLHKQEGIIGSDHPMFLRSLHSKATILHKQGKYNEALRIYQEVLSKRKVVLGGQNFDTLNVRTDIASLFSDQGKDDEALRIFLEVNTIQANTFGENHPDTLATSNNIGMVLHKKGEYDKSLKILRKVLSTRQELYPNLPNHPHTLSVKCNIALALDSQKKKDEALKMYMEVLKSQEASLGKDHHSATAFTRDNIATILLEKGKSYEALKVYREVLTGYNLVFGSDHPNTVRVSENIKALSALSDELLTAVKKNNLRNLEILVKNGGDVNTKDDGNTTLLHYAVSNTNMGIVNILLAYGADVYQISNEGNTPLHIAASKCHKKIVEVLLKHAKLLIPIKLNEFINAKTTESGTTALHIAAEKDNIIIVRLLLRSGAIYNIRNKGNKTPAEVTLKDGIKVMFNSLDKFFKDVKRGNETMVAEFLEGEKAIINVRDFNGSTALFRAVQNGFMDISQLLMENGADPTLVSNTGSTPLHVASSKGNNEIVKSLLGTVKTHAPRNFNSFIDAQTIVGTTALHEASNLAVVKSLLQCGATYNIKNEEGKTPADTAKNDSIKKFVTLIDDLFTTAKNGDHRIIRDLDSIEEIDRFEAVTNCRNDQGHTLLNVAIQNRHLSIARELSEMLKRPGQS